MDKTQAQIDAYQKLTEAIEMTLHAYTVEEISGKTLVLGDYIILAAVQTLTEDDVLITRYPIFMRDGDIPWYRVLGLLKMAELQTEEIATDQNNNG